MRVLVTGATGFVGAWTARAVVHAGHRLRVLVRSPTKVTLTLGELDVLPDEVVQGDMTDPDAVGRALDGVDAVMHAAAVVSMRRQDARAMGEANLQGAQLVVGGAVQREIPRIVAVSSISALQEPGRAHVDRATTVGSPAHGYAASKAAIESYLRGLQEGGAPIATTLATAVCGPPAGSATSEAVDGVVSGLRSRTFPCPDARFSIVDVRDLAEVHLRLLETGVLPARYLCAGTQYRVRDLVGELRDLTGRRLFAAPVPAGVMRAAGTLLDHSPFETVLTAEAMSAYTELPEIDDHEVADELGVTWRASRETLRDSLVGMLAAGQVKPSLVGRVADPA